MGDDVSGPVTAAGGGWPYRCLCEVIQVGEGEALVRLLRPPCEVWVDLEDVAVSVGDTVRVRVDGPLVMCPDGMRIPVVHFRRVWSERDLLAAGAAIAASALFGLGLLVAASVVWDGYTVTLRTLCKCVALSLLAGGVWVLSDRLGRLWMRAAWRALVTLCRVVRQA